MKHFIELEKRSEEKILPAYYVRAFAAGYGQGMRQMFAEMEKVHTISVSLRQSILAAASAMLFSQRTMRVFVTLYHHDLTRVKDSEKFLVLDSVKTYFLSIGCCVGAYIMNSMLLCTIVKDAAVCSTEHLLIFLDKLSPDRERIKTYTVEQITEDTHRLNDMNEDLFLFAMKIAIAEDSSLATLNSFLNIKEPRLCPYTDHTKAIQGMCDPDEEDMKDMHKMPVIIEMKLPAPRMKKLSPEDSAERDTYFKIIEKNPGYGLPFWEFMRELTKDHGVYFAPKFQLAKEYASRLSADDRSRIIGNIEEKAWE
jgi:hypothetical protein